MHPIDDGDEDDNDINFRFNDLKVRHSCQEKFQSNPSCGKVRCTNHRRISPQRPTDHRHSALVRPRSEVRRCTRHDICWNKTQVRFNVQPDPVCRRPGGLPRSVEIADDWDSRKSIRRLYINPNPLSRKNAKGIWRFRFKNVIRVDELITIINDRAVDLYALTCD